MGGSDAAKGIRRGLRFSFIPTTRCLARRGVCGLAMARGERGQEEGDEGRMEKCARE
jgi:hypothetical protein